MPRPIKLALLLGVQAGLVVLGVELAMRVLGPRVPDLRVLLHQETTASESLRAESLAELMDSTSLGFRPCREEHGFVLNSRGFRSGEWEPGPDPSKFRVLVLGDSQAYGVVPLGDHWATLLAEGLARKVSEPVEVLNLGVPGTGLPFYVRLWELEGRWLKPDLVVLLFYAGNDLVDGLGELDTGDGLADWLAWKSHGFRALRNAVRIVRDANAGSWPATGTRRRSADLPCGTELPEFADHYRDDLALFPLETYLEIEASRMSILHRSNERKLRDHLDQVRGLVRRLGTGVRANGGRLVIAVLPDELQVDPELAKAAAEFDEEPPALYDLEAPQRALRRIGEAERIEVLDPLERFRTAGSRLYRPRETHLNRAGNRLFGEFLVERLTSSGN